MNEPAQRLAQLVEQATPALLELSEEESGLRPAPGKWSPRELLGHLVDSASNNHQRFVRARFTDDLVFPGYDQDAWVEAQRYGSAAWPNLIRLWQSFNVHLVRVIASTPDDVLERSRTRHNLDAIAFRTVPPETPTTLAYFMADYVDHLEHHLAWLLGEGWNAD